MNITDILDELGIQYRRSGESKDVRSNWVGIVCVWCGRGEYSLGIRGWGCSCWRCGKKKLGESLAEASGRSLREVLGLLGGVEKEQEEPEHRGRLVIPKDIGPMTLTHIRYLEGRGLNSAEIEDVWGVQGIAIAPRLAWRLFIPIKDRSEQMVSWTTRSLLDCKDRRYISAAPEEEIESPKNLLYGEHLAGHSIVVVEGPTDVWRIGPGAVATMGVDWTDAQRLLIGRHPVRAICFDSEPFAQRRARELYEQLEDLPGQTLLMHLETAKDPGGASDEEVAAIRAKAGI